MSGSASGQPVRSFQPPSLGPQTIRAVILPAPGEELLHHIGTWPQVVDWALQAAPEGLVLFLEPGTRLRETAWQQHNEPFATEFHLFIHAKLESLAEEIGPSHVTPRFLGLSSPQQLIQEILLGHVRLSHLAIRVKALQRWQILQTADGRSMAHRGIDPALLLASALRSSSWQLHRLYPPMVEQEHGDSPWNAEVSDLTPDGGEGETEELIANGLLGSGLLEQEGLLAALELRRALDAFARSATEAGRVHFRRAIQLRRQYLEDQAAALLDCLVLRGLFMPAPEERIAPILSQLSPEFAWIQSHTKPTIGICYTERAMVQAVLGHLERSERSFGQARRYRFEPSSGLLRRWLEWLLWADRGLGVGLPTSQVRFLRREIASLVGDRAARWLMGEFLANRALHRLRTEPNARMAWDACQALWLRPIFAVNPGIARAIWQGATEPLRRLRRRC